VPTATPADDPRANTAASRFAIQAAVQYEKGIVVLFLSSQYADSRPPMPPNTSTTMTENRVVIYSNGIADFQRKYAVEANEPRRIAIPVRRDHLADVLASFNVFGNVKLESPPTFRPSNELEGSISIDSEKVLEDFGKKLSGARVRVERPSGVIEGALVGLHREPEATAGEPIRPRSLIVLTKEGLRRCVLREIQNLAFLDDDVQREIDKALQRNYQRIKPNSTFVELELSAAENADAADAADALEQYTIPAAASKISYRLRMAKDREAELQGFAIVDNNTDEDWTDYRVCVVTGEPITFSTDLAESKTPRRKHVDLVSEEALGSVEVEEGVMMAARGPASEDDMELAMLAGAVSATRRMRKAESSLAEMPSAQTTSAEIHEVGDFNIFESESAVSIPAKRSAVIPVFNVAVADTQTVLHYKHETHDRRPFRSIDFVNGADFSLGRGVCTVFEEGAYAGSCIIPALKPGESRLLPHALETGVSVERDQKRQRNKMVALRLADGFCYTSTRERRETHYHLKNSRDQEFKLALDHTFTLTEPEIEARREGSGKPIALGLAAQLANGARYEFSLAPHEEAAVKVFEQRVAETKVDLITRTKRHDIFQVEWLEKSLVKSNGPLANDEGIRACLEIHGELESTSQEISGAVQETERLAARQERLRQNIKSGGQDELTSRWRNELDEAEQEIRRLEEQTLPELRKEEKRLRAELKRALRSLSAEWSEDGS